MMRSLFDMDSPLMSGLGKVFDCIMLSVCWILASLPVVTMGAACGALYRTVYRCIRRDDGSPFKMFWQTLRQNLKTGIITWLPILGVYALLILDAVIMRGLMLQGQAVGHLYGIVLVLIGVASVWAAYCTAYCVRFNGTLKETLWINFFLVLSHPLMTAVMLLFLAFGIALSLMVPFLTLFVPALVCLAISFPMETVFLKHMRPEDIEKLKKEQQDPSSDE